MLQLFFTIFLGSLCAFSSLGDRILSAPSSLNIVEQKETLTDRKGDVLISLSSICPCSSSHTPYLNSLAEKFPSFRFIGLHTDHQTSLEKAVGFYREHINSFPVFKDQNHLYSRELKALTTPHTFIFSPDGKLLYQGAVTSSHSFDESNTEHLKIALEQIEKGQRVRPRRTKPLGCKISYARGAQ